jgi:arabinogalactan oligomer/maltooligosaccharide transport system permease protein
MALQSLRRKGAPYLYLSPALISVAILTLGPLFYTIYLGFTDASLYTMKSGASFIGLANFVEIIHGSFAKSFFPVFGWNISYAFIAVGTQYAVGMFVALLLNNPNMKESRFYRAILILPWAIPGTLATLAWKGLFNTSGGSINLWLTHLLHIDPIPWLQTPNLARTSVLIVSLWLGFPWFMTVCVGALQSIGLEIYEAADIDGANIFQKFWKITFPLMLRLTTPLLIGAFALNFNNMGATYLMTDGGPPRLGSPFAGSTDILVSVGYKLSTNLYRYGLSAAVSGILFVIVVVVSMINMKATGAFGEED